jgi:hypothetical protein
MRFIYRQSFMLISLTVLELYPGQSSKYKNELPTKVYVETLVVTELCPGQEKRTV